MTRPTGKYAALGFLFLAALVYQVRYTMYRFPTWFNKTDTVEFPFLVFPDESKPGFTMYVLPNAPIESASDQRNVANAIARAHLQNGETVLAIDGKPLTGSAVFGEALARHHPGDSLAITVLPKSKSGPVIPQTVHLPLIRARVVAPVSSKLAGLLLLAILPWFCFLLGFWVAAIRPRDPRAWLVLALMLGFAGFFNPLTESWEPWLRDYGMAYHVIVSDCLVIWFLLFGIYFPEAFPSDSRWARWARLKWIIIIPLALEAAGDLIISVGALENYPSVFFLQGLFRPFRGLLNLLDLAGLIAMFLCFAAKFRLAPSRDAKRRLRLLFAGAAVSLAPLIALDVAAHLLGVNAEQHFPHWLNIVTWLMFFLFPLTLAYVVVVHRAMDVRVVIRQGLQYAVARGGIRALRLALAIVLGAAIFSLIAHVGNTSFVKYMIIVVGVAVWFGLRRLVESLARWTDRRFFRDAYNAEQLLSELSEKVRSIFETQPLLATVAGRISESLHVPRVAVLTDGSGPYQPTYALGYDHIPRVLFDEHAATVRQLREAKEPARVYFDDPNSWLYKTPDMTDDERARLAELQPELLLPLSVKDNLLGFISLGQKRSEEPYSRTDVRLLESVAAQTGLALEVARLTTVIGEEMAQRERLNRELEIAREVQQRLFPQTLPSIPGLDFCGACRPALGVGGDYYDFLALPQGKLGVALGDVSGKGIAAALMMASLQASLRAEASRGADNLGAMIQKVNQLLHDATADNRYATFFYAQYDPAARRLNYVNAGHNPPFLFKKCDRRTEVVRLEVGGTVIGLFGDFSFEQGTVALDPGDLLIAFTDGVTETMNSADEEWGEANLIRSIQDCFGLSANQIMAYVMAAADAFAAGARQHDDMTLVVLRLIAN